MNIKSPRKFVVICIFFHEKIGMGEILKHTYYSQRIYIAQT